jgi:hypothetical protein
MKDREIGRIESIVLYPDIPVKRPGRIRFRYFRIDGNDGFAELVM